jgi:precorrin-6Y C5,15-methyltransferase (decarboxylating)
MKYSVIGLSNDSNFTLSDEVKNLLPAHNIFSGGKRHYELVKKHLPIQHTWIEIKTDIRQLIAEYKLLKEPIVVFASGDPLFYGMANSILKYHPDADIKVYPHFNSIQLLCHKCNIPYHSICNTSVHGRSWDELDQALIYQKDLIGVLTDNHKTPAEIAKHLLDYGFDNYKMVVGEAMEGEEEARSKSFHPLNCLLLIKVQPKEKYFGIPDTEFAGLENRPNMITKMPIRLVSLSQLDLYNRKSLWDVGFCTGSVSIEAKNQFPFLHITAFEKREECSALFDLNTRKHATPGILKIMGDFFEHDLNIFPAPDAIFIGGHGNKLEALILLLDKYLLTKGRLVLNAIKEDSKMQFVQVVTSLNYTLLKPIVMTLDENNSITILTAEKK